jgi:hypothetical protein
MPSNRGCMVTICGIRVEVGLKSTLPFLNHTLSL